MSELLARRNHELTILTTIAAALNREVDLSRALEAALVQVAELFGLRSGWIWLLNEQGNPYLAAARQLPPALTSVPERMAGSCYCLDAFRAGGLDDAANISVITCSRLRKLSDGTEGLRYHASIPLYAHGRKIGVMNVASADWRELSSDDLRLLYAVGDLLGIAVERARLFIRSAELGALEERNRIAREIHDTLAQGMTAVALQLETADVLLEHGTDTVRARAAVQRALQLTQSNLEDTRRSVLDLRAAPLEGRSLADALSELVDAAHLPHGLSGSFSVSGPEHPLPARVTAGLYRIAQEAISNVVRHAHAHTLTLRLVASPERIQLVIEDDGYGFDPAHVASGHFGLLGMRERASLLAGTIAIASTPGVGTRIVADVPLPHL